MDHGDKLGNRIKPEVFLLFLLEQGNEAFQLNLQVTYLPYCHHPLLHTEKLVFPCE